MDMSLIYRYCRNSKSQGVLDVEYKKIPIEFYTDENVNSEILYASIRIDCHSWYGILRSVKRVAHLSFLSKTLPLSKCDDCFIEFMIRNEIGIGIYTDFKSSDTYVISKKELWRFFDLYAQYASHSGSDPLGFLTQIKWFHEGF